MVNSPKSEIIEAGAKLAQVLNENGANVTFGKRSEGNTDLSTIINMAIDDMDTSRLTIEEKIPANTGYFKSYRFKWKDTYLSPDIDIPKDFLLKSVTLETCETNDYPVEGFVVGDKYIDFVVNVKEGTATDEHLYLNVNTFGSALSVEVGTFTDLKNAITNANRILILDKDYKYDATVDTSEVLNYGIPIEKNITIIGNGHIIDGNDTVRALSITGEYVVNLCDLRIQNCKSTINAFGGAIYIDQNATVNMNNLQIINNSVVGDGTVGGAIAAWNSIINITNTEFIQNNATGIETRGGAIFVIGNMSLNNCTFKDNTATLRAGAIHMNGTLSMIDCSFKNNTATNYANIYSNNTVTVYDCIIPNINTSCYNVSNITSESLNTSKQNTLISGTNIKTINNESLLGSGNITIQGGGAEVGTFTDLQTLITNATAPSGQIPVIILDKDYQYDSTTDSSLTNGISISKNITIIGNGHIIDGNNTKRAFYIHGQYIFNLFDLRIQNCNSISSGGVIDADSSVTINITNTTFNQNNANTYGGAIFIGRDCNLIVTNCTFNKNNANNRGGAIYSYNAIITMRDSSFKNNIADSYANIDCNSATTVYNCDINDISITCHNVTNKPYLTDNQSIPSASTSTSGIVQLVDNLTTNDDSKALTAKQGKALADMIGDAITYINQ